MLLANFFHRLSPTQIRTIFLLIRIQPTILNTDPYRNPDLDPAFCFMPPENFYINFFKTVLLPQEMYLHHPGGFYYSLYTVLHSSFTPFLWFLLWEQGLVLGAFCHTFPSEENRNRNISILSISRRSPGTRTKRVRNSPQQYPNLDGYLYVLYTMYTLYSRPE